MRTSSVAFLVALTLGCVTPVAPRTPDNVARRPTEVRESAEGAPWRRLPANDWGRIPVLAKAINYTAENYFDKRRLQPAKMLLGALFALQQAVPELVIDRPTQACSTSMRTAKCGGHRFQVVKPRSV